MPKKDKKLSSYLNFGDHLLNLQNQFLQSPLHKKLKEEFSDTSLNEKYKDVMYRAKRSVFRLMTSLEQGTQKGMPEMVSVLLGEKEFYCTHSFCILWLYPFVKIAREQFSSKPADIDLAQKMRRQKLSERRLQRLSSS